MSNTAVSKYHRSQPIRDFSPEQTLYNLVMRENQSNMDRSYALYFGCERTFSQLKDETDRLAAAFYNNGVRNGSIVGVCMLTIPEVAPVLLALNKLGAVSFWMDVRTSPSDVIHYIKEMQIDTMVIIEPFLHTMSHVMQEVRLHRVVVVPPMNFLGVSCDADLLQDADNAVSYAEFISSAGDDIPTADYVRDKYTVIVQSSGSTGKSKAIAHTDFNLNMQIRKMAYVDFPFYVGRKAFVCAPPWVVYGLVNSIYSGLVLGLETVFSLKPSEDMLYKNLEQLDIVFGVPVYYRYLYNIMLHLSKSPSDDDHRKLLEIRRCLRNASVFISGGDRLSENELITWQLMFDVPITNGYGNNEVVGAAIVCPLFANRPGSIGIPMHGTIVKTFDAGHNEILPDGSTGEIIISSEALFCGYIGNPEETRKIKQFHGDREWVHTGDLGYIDADGYVYIKGRTKRLIIDKLGYKISPDSIEAFIQNLPYVRECAVVGVDYTENSRVPLAFIQFEDDHSRTEVLLENVESECRRGLKDYEQPKFFVEIDAVPHKENGGKTDFLYLEQLAASYIGKMKSGVIQ